MKDSQLVPYTAVNIQTKVDVRDLMEMAKPLRDLFSAPLIDGILRTVDDVPTRIMRADKDRFGGMKEFGERLESSWSTATSHDGSISVRRGIHELTGFTQNAGTIIKSEGMWGLTPFQHQGREEITHTATNLYIKANTFFGRVEDRGLGVVLRNGSFLDIQQKELAVERREVLRLLEPIFAGDGNITSYDPMQFTRYSRAAQGEKTYNSRAGWLDWKGYTFPTEFGQVRLSFGAKYQAYVRYRDFYEHTSFNGGTYGVQIGRGGRTIDYGEYHYVSPVGAMLEKMGLMTFD